MTLTNSDMNEFVEIEKIDVVRDIDYYANKIYKYANDMTKVHKLLNRHWKKDKQNTLYEILYTRKYYEYDYKKFYNIYSWLFVNHSIVFLSLLPDIVYYGSWKDLIDLSHTSTLYISSRIREYISNQLKQDNIELLNNIEPRISELAIYMPTENGSLDKRIGIVSAFCERLNISRKQYRKLLSALRLVIRSRQNDNVKFSILNFGNKNEQMSHKNNKKDNND